MSWVWSVVFDRAALEAVSVPLIASATWSGGRLLVRGQYDLALTFIPTDGVSAPAATWQYLIP